jgi:hypothetical protein
MSTPIRAEAGLREVKPIDALEDEDDGFREELNPSYT